MATKKSSRECSDNSLILARRYRAENKFARAFAHYLVYWHLSNQPGSQSVLCPIEEINQLLIQLTGKLRSQNRFADLASTLQQAIEVLPENEDWRCQLAELYIKLENFEDEALKMVETCQSIKAKDLSNTLKSNLIQRWHFAMLNDAQRNSAYQKALIQVVSPRDKVIDVGTGTGILALFAAKARPQKVIACDASKTFVDMAKKVTQRNCCIEVIHSLSTHLKPEEKFDVLVTETFDAGLLGKFFFVFDTFFQNISWTF